MVERPKSGPLSGGHLWYEVERERITLADRETMQAGFEKITSLKHPDDRERAPYYQTLLKHAGKTMLVSMVPAVIVHEIRTSYAGTDLGEGNLRTFMLAYVPSIIDAMVPDPVAAQKAKDFLADALSG